jgi:tetratricopeptide (TPR) repeat protein
VGDDAKLGRALTLFDEGSAHLRRGEHALAVDKLTASVAIAPTAPSLAALGQSLFCSARYAEAVVHLAAAVGMGDARWTMRSMLASAIAKSGDRNEGLRRLKEMLQEQPDDLTVRQELKNVLSDPLDLIGIANRERLLDGIRNALPEIRMEPGDTPIDGFKLIGRYIASWAAAPADAERLQRAFSFLNDVSLSGGQEEADLLTATVFPILVSWDSAILAAQEMLGGRARRAFDVAVALWGPPIGTDASLSSNDLHEELRFMLPDPILSDKLRVPIGGTIGRWYVAAVEASAAPSDIKRVGRLLSRMAASDDGQVRDAFNDALAEIAGARTPAAIDIARRDLTGSARTAIDNLC